MNMSIIKLALGTVLASSVLVACNNGLGGSTSKKKNTAAVVPQTVVCAGDVVNLISRINAARTGVYSANSQNMTGVPQNTTVRNSSAGNMMWGSSNRATNNNVVNNVNNTNNFMPSNYMDINSDCVQLEQKTVNLNACTNQTVAPNVIVDVASIRAYCKSLTTNATNGTGTVAKDLRPTKTEIEQLEVIIDEDSVGQVELSILDAKKLKGLKTRYAGWTDTDGLYIPLTACSVKNFLPENEAFNPNTDGKLLLTDFTFDQANKDVKLLWLIPMGTDIVSKFSMEFTSDKNPDIGMTLKCEYKIGKRMAESLGGVPDVSQGLMNYVFKGILKFDVKK